MPLTKLQIHVLSLLAEGRSPDSYIAGGIAINRSGPRFSRDIDIFQDSESRLESASQADAKALTAAGLAFSWGKLQTGKRQGTVGGLDETMQLEWVADSAFRFFPAQPDKLFGYVLHPVDLATNKASAAADRREPRDVIDLLTIHARILPLGAVVSAAVGRFPGQSPEEMLADINRHSRFTAEEFNTLAVKDPLDAREIHQRIRVMIDDADQFLKRLPSDAIGFVFLDGETPVQPDVDRLKDYRKHGGTTGGVWPTSREITTAMIEHYQNTQS